jgi:FAD/FMN-containing dehydrogenase
MAGIEVDPYRRTARVEAGVRWAQLLPELGDVAAKTLPEVAGPGSGSPD